MTLGQAGNLTPERRAWLESFRMDTSPIRQLTRDTAHEPAVRVPGQMPARSIEDVTAGLGLDAGDRAYWQMKVAQWMQEPNDLRVRTAMLPELTARVHDATTRMVLYRRVLECYRELGCGDRGLAKGASHKYLKRVPTGKQRPRWRYIYRLPAKRSGALVDDDALKTGAKLRVRHRDQEGHFEVLGRNAAKNLVHVRHDESGREAHIAEHDLRAMVAAYHAKRGTPVPAERKRRPKAVEPEASAVVQAAEAQPGAAEAPAPEPPKPPTPGKVGEASLADLQTGAYDRIDGFHARRDDAAAVARTVAQTGREAALVAQPGGFVVVSRGMPAPASNEPPARRQEGAAADLYLRGKGGPEKVQAKWVLVEADDLVASHDAIRFHRRDDYPADVQERRYHEIDAEQHKVDRIARKLEPAIVANTNPDAINGAPIVVSTPSGMAVLGGNGRTMAAQRAYALYPESAADLRAHLAHVAPQFGLSADAVRRMQKPMLVRQMDPGDQSTGALRLLGRRMNEGLTQGLDPRSEEVAIGKTLVNEDVLQTLAAGIGDDQTMPDYLTGAESRPFVAALFRAGVIDEINAAQFIDPETKLLNEAGRTRAERVLAARMLPDASILDRMSPSLRSNVALSTASLITAEREGWDLRGPLMAAVKADLDMRAKGYQSGPKEIARYLAQRQIGEVGGPADDVQRDEVAARLLTVVREHNKGRVLPRAMRGVALRAKSAGHQAGSLPGIFESAPETLGGALDAEFGLKPPAQPQASLFASRRGEVMTLVKGGELRASRARAVLYARAQGLAEMLVREKIGAAMGAGRRAMVDAAAITAEVLRDLRRVVETDRTLKGAAVPSERTVAAMVAAVAAVGTPLRKSLKGMVEMPPGGGWEPPTAKRRAWRKQGAHGHLYWYGKRGQGAVVHRTYLDVDAKGRQVRRTERVAPQPATPDWSREQADMVEDLGEVRRATQLVGRVAAAVADAAPPALRGALAWRAGVDGLKKKIAASRDVDAVHAMQEQIRHQARDAADTARAWEEKQVSIFGTPDDVPHGELSPREVHAHAEHAVRQWAQSPRHGSRYLSMLERHHSKTDVRRVARHAQALMDEQKGKGRQESSAPGPHHTGVRQERPEPERRAAAPRPAAAGEQMALFRARMRLVLDLTKARRAAAANTAQLGLLFDAPPAPRPAAPAAPTGHHGPPGPGWTMIPGGKHGGYRKRAGDHWTYWYPGDTHGGSPHAREGDREEPEQKRPEPAVEAPKPAAVEEAPAELSDESKLVVPNTEASAGGKYETTGYVFGSRAEMWELNNAGSLEVDPAVAYQAITRDKALGGKVTAESFAHEREKGVEAEAAYVKWRLLSAVSNRPPDSPEHRARWRLSPATNQPALPVNGKRSEG